ncbi:MAG: O-methyltransferase [Rickettsiales bacterium]
MSRNSNISSRDFQYIESLYAPQDELLSEINEELIKRDMAINISAQEGRILQLLIALHGTKTIVEIGTLAGYSAIWMARALPDDGHLYAINKDPEHVKMADGFFARCECDDRITQLAGDAHKVLPELSAKAPFDMAFIDADKISYPAYLDWAEENIRKGGLIVADNTLLGGNTSSEIPPENIPASRWRNMREFNERLADKTKYNATILPTREGLSVAVKLF